MTAGIRFRPPTSMKGTERWHEAGLGSALAVRRAGMGGKHEAPSTDVFMAVVILALIALLGTVVTLALLGVGG
ncbi:MAG TPA: hypothetical protein VK162_12305 [Streptosporangiaceae bacterium]|nr:hypothetical protein [Streptosporangiaceae bacterium]